VSAPYDGKLETAFVKPGDEVTEGDLLARLDGRELRWEMAGLEADFSRALKSRDSAMAIDNIADSQQKALEMERLQLKIQLCRNRLDNLEIKSPVSGLVISGDLKKTEGAPVAVGQTLFEIAPLDQMIVECEIPEREILYARPNQPVVIRVDAYPLRKWTGEIARIFPKAEVRENASVYVAEMNLDNRSGEFRPGMKGRAKITSERRALGWTLFHRPFESLCMSLGW
jgi:multidrug resistance efflux pump